MAIFERYFLKDSPKSGFFQPGLKISDESADNAIMNGIVILRFSMARRTGHLGMGIGTETNVIGGLFF